MPPKPEKRMANAFARSSVTKTPSCMASMVSPMSWCQQITSSRESSGMGHSSSASPVMADQSMFAVLRDAHGGELAPVRLVAVCKVGAPLHDVYVS